MVSEHEGDFESAIKMFVQSLSINSENCDVLIQLAKLYIRLGQFTQAEKCIRDAISKFSLKNLKFKSKIPWKPHTMIKYGDDPF